jgi:hypothetical protein
VPPARVGLLTAELPRIYLRKMTRKGRCMQRALARAFSLVSCTANCRRGLEPAGFLCLARRSRIVYCFIRTRILVSGLTGVCSYEMSLLLQLSTVPHANDDHLCVRMNPIAKDVGASTEGRENLSPTGVVIHAASDLRKLAQLLSRGFDAVHHIAGGLCVLFSNEIV